MPTIRGELTMLTFEQWCHKNGRRWVGAQSFEEFKKNGDDYTKYREDKEKSDKEKATQQLG